MVVTPTLETGDCCNWGVVEHEGQAESCRQAPPKELTTSASRSLPLSLRLPLAPCPMRSPAGLTNQTIPRVPESKPVIDTNVASRIPNSDFLSPWQGASSSSFIALYREHYRLTSSTTGTTTRAITPARKASPPHYSEPGGPTWSRMQWWD